MQQSLQPGSISSYKWVGGVTQVQNVCICENNDLLIHDLEIKYMHALDSIQFFLLVTINWVYGAIGGARRRSSHFLPLTNKWYSCKGAP